MFTGIIETLGTIKKVTDKGKSEREFIIEADFSSYTKGESISVNGVCLTVTEFSNKKFVCYASKETIEKSNLKSIKAGDKINLERSLQPNSRLGGHFVLGHVDDVSKIFKIDKVGDSYKFEFELTPNISKYIAQKGSISIDGVSLTINQVANKNFSINIIPHTFFHTTLGLLKKGDLVNIEVDVIARYLERLTQGQSKGQSLSEDKLRGLGF